MKKLLILLLLVVLPSLILFGNSAVYISGKGGILIPLKDNNLQMKEEKILIDV
jgi:hypothetical protein